MDDEPDQDALFYIEGPDEDGCVWISSTDVPNWHHNLGPADKVAEVLSQWLASLDDAEPDYRDTHDEKAMQKAPSKVAMGFGILAGILVLIWVMIFDR